MPPQLSTSKSPRRRAVELLRRNVVGDVGHLLGPRVDHVLVVGRIVADVAGDVLLLEAADAVLEAGRAGKRPGPGEPLVALVGQERVAVLAAGPGA